MEQYKRLGRQTLRMASPPAVLSYAAVAGSKEGQGPLAASFDRVYSDDLLGEDSWEKAESHMQRDALNLALQKVKLSPGDLPMIFAGDLLNQCAGTTFALRESGIPFYGLYGACSTMAESLALAAMAIDGGFVPTAGAMTSSHYSSAERQYRFPLDYGGQRTPTAQWTATGSGAVILSQDGPGPCLRHIVTGRIVDAGITDAANMGAAMAPAACDSLSGFFRDTGLTPKDFDLIVTGDLGAVGYRAVRDLMAAEGYPMGAGYNDCGLMLFDLEAQDVHAGGSGCGCSALVLCGLILEEMRKGSWNEVLFCGTGALLSPVTAAQGDSIPAVCHGIHLSNTKGGK